MLSIGGKTRKSCEKLTCWFRGLPIENKLGLLRTTWSLYLMQYFLYIHCYPLLVLIQRYSECGVCVCVCVHQHDQPYITTKDKERTGKRWIQESHPAADRFQPEDPGGTTGWWLSAGRAAKHTQHEPKWAQHSHLITHLPVDKLSTTSITASFPNQHIHMLILASKGTTSIKKWQKIDWECLLLRPFVALGSVAE